MVVLVAVRGGLVVVVVVLLMVLHALVNVGLIPCCLNIRYDLFS